MNEKKDRVDDALNATQAALSEGIVPGGGAALLHARESLSPKVSVGEKIVYQACGKPFEQILVNAGYDVTEAKIIASQISNPWDGYNLVTNKIIDMRKEGIIDPTKVTRTALENAASVAGTVLLTECVVVEEPREEVDNNPLNGMF